MFSLFDVASVVNESWCIVLPHTPDGSEDPLRDEYDHMISPDGNTGIGCFI